MGDVKGFMKVKRAASRYRPVCERKEDFRDVTVERSPALSQEQASRCMDCGTPFCHWGCPIGNTIPDWNDLVFRGRWERAFLSLSATNNLPEITGRLCPALCESACVLGINDDPVTIRENELAIIEEAFRRGIIRPRPPRSRSGKRVAIVGSGPAGLAAADQLNQAGHAVTVFERDEAPGGILRLGIPDFKLEKGILDRRISLLQEEGITFRCNQYIRSVRDLGGEYGALVLAGGCRQARDMRIPGRELAGIHMAMEYLMQSNRRQRAAVIPPEQLIDAHGKKVVVIGGGDTGADCVGTAHRQGAACVVQIEVLPPPAKCRNEDFPWPAHPLLLKTSSSHEEGGERHWSVLTKEFLGSGGRVQRLRCANVEFRKDERACPVMREVPGSDFEIEADMVILAIGFVAPERAGIIEALNLDLDKRGNVATDATLQTSAPGVFCAGDMRRGQSLIVWAIAEGRRCAYHVDRFLCGRSFLPLL